jgi:hypothetical protein
MKTQQAAPLVMATIEMAHGLGLQTTAEGIETREQWTFLRRNGCEEGQGYLLSRPVNAAAIESLLHARQALIRAGNGPTAIQFLPGKITTRTTAALIAASMASGWVGAAAAPGGAAAVMQHVAASAQASAAEVAAVLPFGLGQPSGTPSGHVSPPGAPSAAPPGHVAKASATGHAAGTSAARIPKPAVHASPGPAHQGANGPTPKASVDPTSAVVDPTNAAVDPTHPAHAAGQSASPSPDAVQPSADPSASPK